MWCWGAATHPGQPSGVVHPPGRRVTRRLRRQAGSTRSACLVSGIRCRCAQAGAWCEAVQSLGVSTCLSVFTCLLRFCFARRGPLPCWDCCPHKSRARQSARIPGIGPVPSILSPRGPGHRIHKAWIRGRVRFGVFSCPWPEWRQRRCRSASRSAWLRGGRSGLPCRWRGTAGSREQPPGRSAWLRR
jgi:hypothetical protein